jgi:outer membrane protein insertion porin family/translocation and assembly module TamA
VIGRRFRLGVTCRSLALALATLLGGAAASGVASPAPAAAQDLGCDAGDREVRRLRFVGNSAFDDEALSRVVVTTGVELPQPPAHRRRAPLPEPRRVPARPAAPRGVLPQARLPAGAGRHGGAPGGAARRGRDLSHRRGTAAARGLGARRRARGRAPDGAAAAPVPAAPGSVFDRAALEAARDTIRQRLRDRGYPTADALLSWSTDTARLTADVEVQVVPGPFTRLGRIVVAFDTVAGERPRVPERVVRSTLGVRLGDPVSARDLVDAQRTLYQTDAWRRVELRVDTAGSPGGRGAGADTLATLFVNLAQGDLHAARASAGWATLDCLRLQATTPTATSCRGRSASR